jgi:ferredoxin
MKISTGNSKLGMIPNISLTPIKACGNCKACASKCYALKAYRQYPATKAAWDHNLRQAKDDRQEYFSGIGNYIRTKKPAFFRWHVAGDILDQSYFNYMIQIALMNTETRFLVFTKMHSLDYSARPKNLIVRFSQWPGMDAILKAKAAGILSAWYQDGTEDRIPSNAVKCPGSCENCKACFNSKRDVYFIAH